MSTEKQAQPTYSRPFWKDPVVLIGAAIPTIVLACFFGYLIKCKTLSTSESSVSPS
jgi:hypothetical protein